MHLNELINRQRVFDSQRMTTFKWSSPISESDSAPLLHNVVGLTGEVGELANVVKKYDRGDFDYATLTGILPGELADVFIYVMKLAYQADIDLEDAIVRKQSENEKRFPPSEPAQLPSHPLTERAKQLSSSADSLTLEKLRSTYKRASLIPPTTDVALVAGALVAVEVAKLAEIELNESQQEVGWRELQPLASAVGLTYHDAVSLARYDASFSRILEGSGRQ
jgi:NTP pyrophosphatase (non-canonical NTP hydrolase)